MTTILYEGEKVSTVLERLNIGFLGSSPNQTLFAYAMFSLLCIPYMKGYCGGSVAYWRSRNHI